MYCTWLYSNASLNPFKIRDVDQKEVEEEEKANVEKDEETYHLNFAFGSDDDWS